jgi:hypothetical protein
LKAAAEGASRACSFGVVLLEIVTGIMPVTRGQTAQPIVPDDCPEVRKSPVAQAVHHYSCHCNPATIRILM